MSNLDKDLAVTMCNVKDLAESEAIRLQNIMTESDMNNEQMSSLRIEQAIASFEMHISKSVNEKLKADLESIHLQAAIAELESKKETGE